MSDTTLKKKRGRKPKNFNNMLLKKEVETIPEESVLSEEEKIIFHLPITINEINNMDADVSMFIKPSKKVNMDTKEITEDSDLVESLKTSSNMILNNTVNNR
jgi:hypothetical protein